MRAVDPGLRPLDLTHPPLITMAFHVPNKPAPVFMRNNSEYSFKQMKSEVISVIIKELEEKFGLFEKGGVSIASGGDLFIRPTSIEQQKKILELKKVFNETLSITCSLPNSITSHRVIIRQVPTGDTDNEIHEALLKNGYEITNVHRFTTLKGITKIPSTTVALEFRGPYPHEILLNGLVFRPEKQLPSPLRCKNCQKLGHTERFCTTPKTCPTCGKNHDSTENCTSPPHCVNCNGDHSANSLTCPKFIQMRLIARSASENGVTIQEARSKLYSDAAKTSIEATPDPEIAILKSQVDALQTEMRRIRVEASKINIIEHKVEQLDTAVNHIKNSFEEFQRSQKKMEAAQSTTNAKLDQLMHLFTRNFPNIDEIGNEMEMEEENSPYSPSQNTTSTKKTPQSTTGVSPGANNHVKKLNTGNQKKIK